jgi:hypothetical protein
MRFGGLNIVARCDIEMPLCVEMVRRSWWEADEARYCAYKANQHPEVKAVNMILNDYQLL